MDSCLFSSNWPFTDKIESVIIIKKKSVVVLNKNLMYLLWPTFPHTFIYNRERKWIKSERLILILISQKSEQPRAEPSSCLSDWAPSNRPYAPKPIHNRVFWDLVVKRHFKESLWLQYFRMSQLTFEMLCQFIGHGEQIAITLFQLATCAEYRVVGELLSLVKGLPISMHIKKTSSAV